MPRRSSQPPARLFASASRQGSVYVAVLGVAMIIALIAMASLHLSRAEIDVLTGAEQIAQAELLSQSAVEFAVARLRANPNWRTDYTVLAEVPSAAGAALGSGAIKFSLIDTDFNLSDDDRDRVIVRGIGMAGEATQVTTVLLQPAGDSVESIDVAFHSAGNLNCNGQTVNCNQTVSSNGNITVGAGQIYAVAWAVGSITGSATTPLPLQSPARKMPEPTAVWDYYYANGTTIDIDDIPNQTIDKAVLSAASNPYGATNPQGIYVIDTKGQTLHIRDSRIVATLVVISTVTGVQVESLINWAPPANNYPALMVMGNLTLSHSGGSPLVESTAATNFNPAGTPYESSADSDLLDVYPGIIKGLVYCSGNLSTTSACVMQGSLVAGGTATLGGTLTIAYGSAPAAFPPPGFAHGSVMRVVPRTWRRTAR